MNITAQQDLAVKSPPSGRWQSLWAAWFGEAFDAMDATIYFMALYPCVSELIHSKNDTEIGWYGSLILATFMLGWALGAVGLGILADRIGRTTTMTLSILLYAVATALCALSHSWQELAFYRFLVGIGIGGEIALGTVLIAESWGNRGRLWATATLESSFGVGVMFCAGINMLLGQFGWRWLFVAGLIPAVLALYIRLTLKESSSFENIRQTRQKLKHTPRNKLSADEQQLLGIPLWELLKGPQSKQLLLTAGSCTCAIIGWWACISWIPPWVNQLTGHAAIDQRSMASTILSIGNLIGCFSTPLLIKWLGRTKTLMLAFGLGWLATMTMFLTVKTYGLPLLAWCLIVGVFAVMQFVVVAIYIPEAYATRYLGSAAGFSFGAGRILAAAVAVFGGHLIGFYAGSYAYASATMSLAYLIGFFISSKLPDTAGVVAGDNYSLADAAKTNQPTPAHRKQSSVLSSQR